LSGSVNLTFGFRLCFLFVVSGRKSFVCYLCKRCRFANGEHYLHCYRNGIKRLYKDVYCYCIYEVSANSDGFSECYNMSRGGNTSFGFRSVNLRLDAFNRAVLQHLCNSNCESNTYNNIYGDRYSIFGLQ
jgi:hypothetical protein